MTLVLSLFPGGGLLDHAFELEGFTVVRGPDPLWGGDIKRFHPEKWIWDVVIGGPPCQSFSPIGNVNKARYGEDSVMPDLIPEFRRVVEHTQPGCWLMENSPHAYAPMDPHYCFQLELAWFDERQTRRRSFWSSHNLEPIVKADLPALLSPDAGTEPAVTSCGSVDWKGSRARAPKRPLEDMCELQGLPRDWLEHQPWTMQAKRKIVGNGVPIPMGRALARAIREVMR